MTTSGSEWMLGQCPQTNIMKLLGRTLKQKNEELNQQVMRNTTAEADPHGKSQHEPGAKLDAGKVALYQGLLDYFPRACLAVADISQFGAKKYAWKGWETVPDGINRYTDAEARHLVKEPIEGPLDVESGKLHKAHKAWNAMAALELALREIDNEMETCING